MDLVQVILKSYVKENLEPKDKGRGKRLILIIKPGFRVHKM